jgi:glycosyltransferase involved in cell wall biosynthesis
VKASHGLRIAVVAACPFPYPRGTPIRIRRLAQGLGERGHEVHVATYHLGGFAESDPFRVHRIRDVGWYQRCEPGPSYAKFFILDPLLVRTLRRLVRRHEIDIVHAHHYEGLLVARWARPRCPFVYDAHTTLESELPFYRLGLPTGLKRSVGRMLDRTLPAKAAHVIAVSETIRTRLLELGAVNPDRVDVIPSGVESRLFQVESGNERRVGDARVVAFAGNLGPHQGIEYLLEAFQEVVRYRGDVQLLVVTGSPFAPYEDMARKLNIRDSIVLRDDVFTELPNYLAGADILINPRTEAAGLPQKLLNYMAAGKPIVSFSGSASHLRDGKTALIVKSGDVRSMRAAILRLLDDQEQARKEFDWDRRAAQVEAIYDRVLSRGPEPLGS